MKRFCCLLLVTVIALSLVSCGDNSGTPLKDAVSSASSRAVSENHSSEAESVSRTPPARPKGTAATPADASTPWKASGKIQLSSTGRVDALTDQQRALVDKVLKEDPIDYTDFSAEPVTCASGNFITLKWEYRGQTATGAKVYISDKADLSDAVSYPADTNSVKVCNLRGGKRYYWWVEATFGGATEKSSVGTVDIAPGPSVLNVGGVSNVRDLGGWVTQDGRTVKHGLVYRCAHLRGLNPDGAATLNDVLKVKTELDLRETGVAEAPGFKANWIKVAAVGYSAALRSGTTAESMSVLADIDNYPILFHCESGADRTGTLAALLEYLCNCDEQTVVCDYELTLHRYRGYTESFKKMTDMVRAAEGSNNYEKVSAFLLGTGLTKMQISNIYNILMTDSAIFTGESLRSAKTVPEGRAFTLDLRDSGGIKTVVVNGKTVDYTFSDNTLTVKADKGFGYILFNDGDWLEFMMY